MENITQIFISENNEKLPNFFNKASTAIKKPASFLSGSGSGDGILFPSSVITTVSLNIL